MSRSVSGIPASVWILGGVSMLMDVSSELIHSLLPMFMVSVLGAGALAVGLLEGTAEATALIVKLFSGTLSDYLGRRKPLAVAGYALGALCKPLFAVASSFSMVFVARFADRIGKGIRSAPRDALIADLTPLAVRGAAYGLRQSLDTIGAVIGPLLAMALMLLWSNDFRAVFWVALLPGALAVLLLLFGVREPPRTTSESPVRPLRWHELRRLPVAYWWVVASGAMFTLARFSEAFLILRAGQSGLPLAWIPLVLVAMNLVYALSAYPFGRLSDRVPHSRLLLLGMAVLLGADLLLAGADGPAAVLLGVGVWGLHMGITQGLLATMVAASAPADLRGTAFGFFSLLCGLAMLLASVLAGLLWEQLGAEYTFYASALFAALAMSLVVATRGTADSARAQLR